MDESRLSAIKARMSAASRWTPDECGLKVDPEDGYVYAPQGATVGQTFITLGDTYENSGNDWAFIAHAREDVEDLVAEVERLAVALAEALDAARCEAAEAMRKKAAGLCRTVATVDPRSDVSAQYAEAWRRGAERCEVMILGSALPLDVRPGAS